MSTRLLNLPSLPRWWKPGYTLFIIVLISILLHAWSLWQLPVDFDEPVYLQAGESYARLIVAGDVSGVVHYQGNREHPPLVKLLYSIPYLVGLDQPGSTLPLYMARAISALFGVLAVYFVARRSLWAGLFLAFHSMTLKYSSQAYLEALPMLMIVLAILSLEKVRDTKNPGFWLSAVFFGIAGAAKYPYLIAGIVLIFMMISLKKTHFRFVVLYFGVAFLTFLIFNPNFWANPFQELISVIRFHTAYSQSYHVQSSNYPWYQPALFLASSVPWHPQVFFFVTLDEFIFWIAMVGLYTEIRKRGWAGIWFVSVLAFLLIWPTKWPQYTLMLTPALALLAGFSVERAIEWIRPKEDYWNYLEEMLPQPPGITWWILGGFVAVLLIGKITYEIQLAYARQGWESYTSLNSPLQSNFVTDIETGKPGTIAITTNEGVDIWQSTQQVPIWGDPVEHLSTESLGFGNQKARQIAYDQVTDAFYIGSEGGITRVAETIQHFENSMIGCNACIVNDLAIDSSGQVWVATTEGIFVLSNDKWIDFSTENPGIDDLVIFSLLLQEQDGQHSLWAGTLSGISHYDFVKNSWDNTNWAGRFFGWGGVEDLIETSDGSIIAATSGGGVGILDEGSWSFFRTTNSPMRSNTVLSVIESPDNQIWIGMGYPTEPGGYLMRLDPDGNWKKYFLNTSGYAEGEPVDLEFDEFGRLWIATNGQGIQTYILE